MTVRIMIAEDQTMVRQALVALLELEEDIEVVGQAADGNEADIAVRLHLSNGTIRNHLSAAVQLAQQKGWL